MAFVPGWQPSYATAARAAVEADNGYVRVRSTAKAKGVPVSMSRFRRRFLNQGQVGTCHEHAATQFAETFANANGRASFDVCRNLIGWQGQTIMGSPGRNPAGGGSPTANLQGMTAESGKGVGIAHETLWPYHDNARSCGADPPDRVLSDAKPFSLTSIVDVQGFDDLDVLLENQHPACLAIWWPAYWDTQGGTIFDGIGGGSYGHALCITGKVPPGVFDQSARRFYQIENSHDEIYAPLAADLAAKVPGYKPSSPGKTSDFWVPEDKLRTVMGYGNAELVSATDLAGFPELYTLADVLASPLG